MAFRIALIGASDQMRKKLVDLLQNNNCTVDMYDPVNISSLIDHDLHIHDVIIANSGLASVLKEDTVFNTLLTATGFLIFEEKAVQGGPEPPFLIHAGMSQEDIIAKINNIVYLNSNTRKSTRMKVNLPVEYEYEGKNYQSTLQDLSERGGFILTLVPPSNGTKIIVRFAIPGEHLMAVATGRVIYSIKCNLDQQIIAHPSSRNKKIISLPGVGIVFEQISDKNQEAIKNFIETHL
jgi:PilZ domain